MPMRGNDPIQYPAVEKAMILEEFYSTINHKDPDLANALGVWILQYNYQRVHGSLGEAPMERLSGKIHNAPCWEELANQYDAQKERLYVRDYKMDQRLARLFSGEVDAVSNDLSSKEKQGAQGGSSKAKRA